MWKAGQFLSGKSSAFDRASVATGTEPIRMLSITVFTTEISPRFPFLGQLLHSMTMEQGIDTRIGGKNKVQS